MPGCPHGCPTLRAILGAMLTLPLPYLTFDGTPHALSRIESADASRVRLVFAGPAPKLRDRVQYVLDDGAKRVWVTISPSVLEVVDGWPESTQAGVPCFHSLLRSCTA